MTRKWLAASRVILFLFALFCFSSRPAAAQTPPQQDQKAPTYTIPEYNAFQAAHGEKDPQVRLKLLDDFVAKFPSSTLLPYVYRDYFETYGLMKNYPKVMEWADKILALGDRVELEVRVNVAYVRVTTFQNSYNPRDPNAAALLAGTRAAADLGSQLLQQLKKPANSTDAQFDEQKKVAAASFNGAGGFAAEKQKDYKAAVGYYRAALALNPNDGASSYHLGLAYLLQEPPQSMDGFWALSRAIALKVPGEAQVRDYLKKRLLVYQQPGCDASIDAQMNEMIQLAATSPERPPTYTFPSADDLAKVRQSSTILTVLADLKAGGDKAKLTWLTICGLEFPEVVGKIISVTPAADGVDFKVFTGATEDEMQTATTANMDVKVVDQPSVSRLKKDEGIRFSGTLVGYDPEPFTLHWDKVKVDPSIIPAGEKPTPAKRPVHRPARKPSGQ